MTGISGNSISGAVPAVADWSTLPPTEAVAAKPTLYLQAYFALFSHMLT